MQANPSIKRDALKRAPYVERWAPPAEGGRGNDDAALGILVARKAVRL